MKFRKTYNILPINISFLLMVRKVSFCLKGYNNLRTMFYLSVKNTKIENFHPLKDSGNINLRNLVQLECEKFVV